MRIFCCKEMLLYIGLHCRNYRYFLILGFRADYIAWNGANPDLCAGNKGLAKGTDTSIRSSNRILAQGTNSDLCKGPKVGLAKGSIYSQMKIQMTDVKCN